MHTLLTTLVKTHNLIVRFVHLITNISPELRVPFEKILTVLKDRYITEKWGFDGSAKPSNSSGSRKKVI